MITTVLIFIVVLGILVFVHEFGHFIVAKKSGMVVEEFGFGFPPRVVGIQRLNGKFRMVWGPRSQSLSGIPQDPANEPTIYSINLIPLGGFVKILGENNEHENHPGSFINKGFWARFLTLVAGVTMNVLLAFVIFSIGFMIGLPAAVDSPNNIPAHATLKNPEVAILAVQKDLPADKAGVKVGDVLLAVDSQNVEDIAQVQSYVKSHLGQNVVFKIKRGNENLNINVVPNSVPKENEGPTGIELAFIGKLSYPPQYAIWEGAKNTVVQIGAIFSGLYQLLTHKVGVDNLGGPVKIAKLTGEVAGLGFVYLMQFTAFLSLNLAALNILPFPALDGGRILFLFIEKIRGKKNNQKVEQVFNAAGFLLLIALMVFVTINDIVKK